MKVKHLIWGLILFAGLAPAATVEARTPAETQESEAWTRFGEDLAAKSRDRQTIACRFVQLRKSAALKAEVRKEGTFHYKRPERMRLLFADGDCITMNGPDLLQVSGGRRTVVRMQSNPMFRELQRILTACMTADVEQLTVSFLPSLRETGEQYELTLTPRRKNRLKNIVLTFAERDMSLDALQMNEPSGDYILYRFSDKQFDGPVADRLFEIGKE